MLSMPEAIELEEAMSRRSFDKYLKGANAEEHEMPLLLKRLHCCTEAVPRQRISDQARQLSLGNYCHWGSMNSSDFHRQVWSPRRSLLPSGVCQAAVHIGNVRRSFVAWSKRSNGLYGGMALAPLEAIPATCGLNARTFFLSRPK